MPQPDCKHFMFSRITESSSTSSNSDGLQPVLKCEGCGELLYVKTPRAKAEGPAFAGPR
jgi:hypothetical protein